MQHHFVVGKKYFIIAGQFFYMGRVASVSEYEVVLDKQSVLVWETGPSCHSLSDVLQGAEPRNAEKLYREVYIPLNGIKESKHLAPMSAYFEVDEKPAANNPTVR